MVGGLKDLVHSTHTKGCRDCSGPCYLGPPKVLCGVPEQHLMLFIMAVQRCRHVPGQNVPDIASGLEMYPGWYFTRMHLRTDVQMPRAPGSLTGIWRASGPQVRPLLGRGAVPLPGPLRLGGGGSSGFT